MKEKEYVEYIQKLIINAEQEAMKKKLQTNDETIHLKADGVLALCKLLRQSAEDYANGTPFDTQAVANQTPLSGLYIKEELTQN